MSEPLKDAGVVNFACTNCGRNVEVTGVKCSECAASQRPLEGIREKALELVESWRQAANIRRNIEVRTDTGWAHQKAYAEGLDAAATELENALRTALRESPT